MTKPDRKKLSPILVGLTSVFSLSIFGSYVGLHLEDIGTAVVIIGVVLAMRNVYQLFLRVPLANFSQTVGRKPLLIAGMFSYSLALFIMFISNHWVVVLVATTLVAFGMSAQWPALIAYIGDVEKNNVGQLQGRTFQGTDLGTITGSLLAFLLLNLLDVEFRTLFGITALISLAGTVFLLYYVPESLSQDERVHTKSKLKSFGNSFIHMFRSLYTVTKQKKLLFVFLYQFILAFLEYFVTAFLPFLIVDAKHFAADRVALIMWINSGILIFFKPYFGKLVDRFGFKLPITISLIFSSSMLWFLVFIDSLPWIIFIYVLYSASILTGYIATNTGATKWSVPTQRGLAVGALGFYVSAGRSISTLVLSPIWEAKGVNYIFLAVSVIVIWFVLVLTIVTKFLVKDSQNDMNEDSIPKPIGLLNSD